MNEPIKRITNCTGRYFYCEECGERVETGETHDCYGDPKSAEVRESGEVSR